MAASAWPDVVPDRVRKYTNGVPWQEFLEENRYVLVHEIDAHDFLDYFRSKRVLDKSDCEMIKFCHTSPSKAGEMLDILSKRGEAGFLCFMDILQLRFKELYTAVTHLSADDPPPRLKPDTYQKSSRATSKIITEKMLELVCDLSKNSLAKSEEIQKLADDLKKAEELSEADRKVLIAELMAQKSICDDLKAEIKRLQQQKESIDLNLAEARKQRDHYLDLYNAERRHTLRGTRSPRHLDQSKTIAGRPKVTPETEEEHKEARAEKQQMKRTSDKDEELNKAIEEMQDMHSKQIEEVQKDRDKIQESFNELNLRFEKRQQENEDLKLGNKKLQTKLTDLCLKLDQIEPRHRPPGPDPKNRPEGGIYDGVYVNNTDGC